MPNNNNNGNFSIHLNAKKLLLIFTLISMSIGGVYGIAEAAMKIDSRYMKVSDYKSIKTQERIKYLEEQIFMLNFKVENGTATSLDKAMLERYKSELASLRNN